MRVLLGRQLRRDHHRPHLHQARARRDPLGRGHARVLRRRELQRRPAVHGLLVLGQERHCHRRVPYIFTSQLRPRLPEEHHQPLPHGAVPDPSLRAQLHRRGEQLGGEQVVRGERVLRQRGGGHHGGDREERPGDGCVHDL